MDNILSVTLKPRETVKADAITQYDKGVILHLQASDGIAYTTSTEVQVTDGIADAVRYPVTLNEDGSCQATLGDHLFRNSGLFYAYIYNIYANYEQTTATVCIPVKERTRYECNTSQADKDEENAILVSIREAVDQAESAVDDANEAVDDVKKLLEETIISTPTASVEQTKTGATVTITDKNGTTTADILNGKDGSDGKDGADGKDGEKGANGKDGITPNVSATATVAETTGTPAVTVTKTGDATTPSFEFSFTGLKGERGDKGDQGIQGERGEKGDSYTITDADYSAIAEKVLASLEDADTTAF